MKTPVRITPATVVVTLILAAQAAVFYTMSHGDAVPLRRPLAEFPARVGPWTMAQDDPIDKETREVLGADSYLNRIYTLATSGDAASLYVAYWQTQQTGQSPHSPKNCLPGNGWVPSFVGTLDLAVSSRRGQIRVNQYVVSRGNDEALVLYWYQSNNRVVASEYTAKVYTVLDSLRYHRSDTALVRVLIGIPDGNEAAARAKIAGFVDAFFGPLRQFLPA